jgi:hypothetical protein
LNHKTLLKQGIIFLLFASLLFACGSPAPQPTPTPTSIPPTATPVPFAKEGHWETVGDAYSPVSFDVTADGKIRNFNILVGGDCDTTVNIGIPIGDNHQFILGEVDAEGKLTNNGIIGTFDTPTTVSGSFDSSWECPLSGGGVNISFYPQQLAVWTAEWQAP